MTTPTTYPRPLLTVDVVCLARNSQLLLIRRGKAPHKGAWALPGGFVNDSEPLEMAARRELREETGLTFTRAPFEQVGAFGDPGRDPRGWTVSVAFLVRPALPIAVTGRDDAADARWFHLAELPALAFDHRAIVDAALRHVRSNPF